MAAAPAPTPVDTLYILKPLELNGVFAPCPSPFCTKAMAYVVLRDLPVELKVMADPNPPPKPKGKWPYVQFGSSGKIVGDSSFIIEEYELARPEGERLDAWLSPERKAVALTVKRTLEESFYWSAIIERRWRDKDNFQKITVPMFFGGMAPCCLPDIIGAILWRQQMRDYYGQGIARHTPEEVKKMAVEDLQAMEALVVGPYFHGSRVSSTDLLVYSFFTSLKFNLANWKVPESGPETLFDTSCPKLQKIVAAMGKQLEPGLRKLIGTKLVSKVG